MTKHVSLYCTAVFSRINLDFLFSLCVAGGEIKTEVGLDRKWRERAWLLDGVQTTDLLSEYLCYSDTFSLCGIGIPKLPHSTVPVLRITTT